MFTNINISEIKEIVTPSILIDKYMPSVINKVFIEKARLNIQSILNGWDKKLIVIVGPCSIHDYDLAIQYAKELKKIQESSKNLYIVMRVYFEKPRSRVGWKGFIYDPDLNDTFNINKGLELARKLLLEITKLEIPIGCEFLDTITPQYLSDLVSWGAIGARTSESQIHRQLASGLSMPIGFKNLTSGDYEKAIDGIVSASFSHNFLGIDEKGVASHVITKGNKDSHLILRGGDEPNYNEECIEKISKKLENENIKTGIIVDCSHGNSQKEYNRQILVALYIKKLRLKNKYPIRGIMLESNINKGNQKISYNMKKGVSITDACIDIETTKNLLKLLDENVCKSINNLETIRKIIKIYDSVINIIIKHGANVMVNESVISKYTIDEDKEIAEICKNRQNEENLLMMISMRLGLSENVAEIKFKDDPFDYLNIRNDFLKLITKREIEKEILNLYKDPIYLKIIEISKNIQVKFLEKYVKDIKIGYLFGKGTFSHEVITQNLRGNHIVYSSIEELKIALIMKEVNFIIMPTYNSLIGEIYHVDSNRKVVGTIDHKIELCLYSNCESSKEYDVLYIEPHILKECKKYVDKLKVRQIEIVKSSVEGCTKIIKSYFKCLTISSKNNESNFLNTLDSNIVDHNITTFSLIQ